MTEAKHIPGPWSVGNTDPLMFGAKRGHGTEPLGYVYGPSHAELSEHGRTCLANARLISAAPDLLDALQRALAVWDLYRESESQALIEARDAAETAIEKATGAQQ